MASITLVGTVNRLSALTVPGIKIIKKSPPTIVSTAQLPCMYLRNGVLTRDEYSLANTGGHARVAIEAVVLVDSSRQGTQDDLYQQTREIVDSLHDVLNDNAPTLRLDAFAIREAFEAVGDTAYSVVVAEIICS